MTSRTPLRPRSTGWHRNADRPCSRGRSCPRHRRQFRSAAAAPAMRHGCCDACEPVPPGLRARFRPGPLRFTAPAGAGKTLRRRTAGNRVLHPALAQHLVRKVVACVSGWPAPPSAVSAMAAGRDRRHKPRQTDLRNGRGPPGTAIVDPYAALFCGRGCQYRPISAAIIKNTTHKNSKPRIHKLSR